MFKVKHPWRNDTFSKVVYLWNSVRSKNITQEHGGCKGKGDMAKAGMAVVITVTFSKKKKKKKNSVANLILEKLATIIIIPTKIFLSWTITLECLSLIDYDSEINSKTNKIKKTRARFLQVLWYN